MEAVNPKQSGAKAAAVYHLDIASGERVVKEFRLRVRIDAPRKMFGRDYENIFERRRLEAEAFYAAHIPQ